MIALGGVKSARRRGRNSDINSGFLQFRRTSANVYQLSDKVGIIAMAELAFRMQMRGMAPGNNQSLWRKPRCSRSRQVSNATCAPMLCPASKSGVSGDTDASSSFASSAASCVMLLSGSRWRRRSRPGQSPEKARNQPVAQLASGETRYCCRQRKGT